MQRSQRIIAFPKLLTNRVLEDLNHEKYGSNNGHELLYYVGPTNGVGSRIFKLVHDGWEKDLLVVINKTNVRRISPGEIRDGAF